MSLIIFYSCILYLIKAHSQRFERREISGHSSTLIVLIQLLAVQTTHYFTLKPEISQPNQAPSALSIVNVVFVATKKLDDVIARRAMPNEAISRSEMRLPHSATLRSQ
jgi:hypothetical protein